LFLPRPPDFSATAKACFRVFNSPFYGLQQPLQDLQQYISGAVTAAVPSHSTLNKNARDRPPRRKVINFALKS